jgi:hypothetical protein
MNNQPYPGCIETIYVEEKDNEHKFDINDLDSDFSHWI